MPELWQSYGSQADPVPKTVAVYSNQKTKACSLQRISLLSPSQEVLLTRRCVRACVCVCAVDPNRGAPSAEGNAVQLPCRFEDRDVLVVWSSGAIPSAWHREELVSGPQQES